MKPLILVTLLAVILDQATKAAALLHLTVATPVQVFPSFNLTLGFNEGDFMDAYWRDWHWPAFNMADVVITRGAGLILLSVLPLSRKGFMHG